MKKRLMLWEDGIKLEEKSNKKNHNDVNSKEEDSRNSVGFFHAFCSSAMLRCTRIPDGEFSLSSN